MSELTNLNLPPIHRVHIDLAIAIAELIAVRDAVAGAPRTTGGDCGYSNLTYPRR